MDAGEGMVLGVYFHLYMLNLSFRCVNPAKFYMDHVLLENRPLRKGEATGIMMAARTTYAGYRLMFVSLYAAVRLHNRVGY